MKTISLTWLAGFVLSSARLHKRPCYAINNKLIAIILLTALVFSNSAFAQSNPNITVALQHKTAADTSATNVLSLGPGTKVNPDTNSLIRVHVGNLPSNCFVTKVQLVADRLIHDDVLQDNIAPGDSLANRSITPDPPPYGPPNGGGSQTMYNTDWETPANDPSIPSLIKSILPGAYATTELYARVYIQCQTGPATFVDIKPPYESNRIIVPENVRDADSGSASSSTQAQGGVNAGGSAGLGPVKAGATVTAGGTNTTSHCQSYHTAFIDPTISDAILITEPLPAGWSLALDPPTFILGTNDTLYTDLLYQAPSSGIGLYYIKNTSVTPSGTFTNLTGPFMLIIDPSPVPVRKLTEIQNGSSIYHFLSATTNGQVTDITFTYDSKVTNLVLQISLQAQADGNLQLLVPRDILNVVGRFLQPAFYLDGVRFNPTISGSNSLYSRFEIPFKTTSQAVKLQPSSPEFHGIGQVGGSIVVEWFGGTLQSATSPRGPWADLASSSPYTAAIGTAPAAFYRIRQ